MLENSIRMLRRRWGLVLIALLAGYAAGIGAFLAFPPTQQSTAAVLFVPSVKQPGVEGPTNPLLELSGSVGVVASVIQIAVTDDETVLALEEAGHAAEYEVVPDLSENAGPVLLVTAKDTNAAVAEGTRDAVVAQISNRLEDLQDARNVNRELRVSTVLLTAAPEPEVIRKKQIQVAVAAGGATTAVLLLLVLLVEKPRQSSRGRVMAPGEGVDGEAALAEAPTAVDESTDQPGVLTGSARRTV